MSTSVEKISVALPPELRALWQQAIAEKSPGVSAEDVLTRIERKYQALTESGSKE